MSITWFAASVGVTQWASNTVGAGITISASGLTATLTGSSNASAYSDFGAQIGDLMFFSVSIDNLVGTPFVVGLASYASVKTNHTIGQDSASLGYASTGVVSLNTGTVATLSTFTTGDVIDVALDTVNRTVWFRKNGGQWNNSGTANPSTNTGGISVSGFTGTFLATTWAAITLGATNDACTVNFGQTAFTYAPPTGFSGFFNANMATVYNQFNPTFDPPATGSVTDAQGTLDQPLRPTGVVPSTATTLIISAESGYNPGSSGTQTMILTVAPSGTTGLKLSSWPMLNKNEEDYFCLDVSLPVYTNLGVKMTTTSTDSTASDKWSLVDLWGYE